MQRLATGQSAEFVDPGVLSSLEAAAAGGGMFSTVSSDFVVVPGTHLAFVLSKPSVMFFSGFATGEPDATVNVPDVQIGLRVDGTDYPGNILSFSGTVTFLHGPLTVSKPLLLAAGAHTADLVIRKPGLSPGTAAIVQTNAGAPASLSMIY